MKNKGNNWLRLVTFGLALTAFAACKDDDDNQVMGKGDVDFEITDAAIDDADVKNVFVTVTDVKVDGKSVSGFTKQTIDLKAYQEGNTKLLVSAMQLDAKTYGNVVLVLDLDKDANGATPGTYVNTTGNIKYKLNSTASGTKEITLTKDWTVTNGAKTNVVFDFNLRKAIAYSSDPSVRYRFVSDDNLKSAIRVVAKAKAGTIKGTYSETNSMDADKIMVYAYKKGTYNASTETSGQGGDDNIFFANSVTNAEVKSDLSGGNKYTLALVEEGDYDLYFVSYQEDPSTHRLVVKDVLQSENSIDGTVNASVNVKTGTTVNVATIIKGIL